MRQLSTRIRSLSSHNHPSPSLTPPPLSLPLSSQIGLLTAFGLLFGNRMLVCSPLSAAVLAMLLLLLTLEDLLQLLPALPGALARLGLGLVGTVGIRLELSHLLQDQADDVSKLRAGV